MAFNKTKTGGYERIIRACFDGVKDNDEKEVLIAEALDLMSVEGRLFYQVEDSDTGTILGYEIEDARNNSIKSFRRK